MKLFLDALWRAAIYCLHPRIIALSFLPLLLIMALAFCFGYFYWDITTAWMLSAIDSLGWLNSVWDWMAGFGVENIKNSVAKLIIVLLITPILIISSILTVAVLMTPIIVKMVEKSRFSHLESKKGGTLLSSLVWSLGSSVLALVAIVVTLPLWLIPPFFMLLPPAILGWLTYRVMVYDTLAWHASKQEREAIFENHRPYLLTIGIISGLLGIVPGIILSSGIWLMAAFIVIVPFAIWLYTLVFAFSALWFAHYCLAALDLMRQENTAIEIIENDNNQINNNFENNDSRPSFVNSPEFGIPYEPEPNPPKS